MPYDDYRCLKVHNDKGVAFITIDHPPINLFDLWLISDLNRIGKELEQDEQVRAIVFQSADPEFFIAHADVRLIHQMPSTPPPKSNQLGLFHEMVERYRNMPKVSIGKIEGRARGGGSEFLLSLDMRFGAIGKTILSQPEVSMGIIPGGSGTQRLPRLIGRGRALEVIMGCRDFDAELAERYGWINRALPPDELTPFVEELAYRIATFPPQAIALAKAAVNAAEPSPVERLLEEAHFFNITAANPEAKQRMVTFLENGGQTREVEIQSLNDPIEKSTFHLRG